jgi:hypothetical protein
LSYPTPNTLYSFPVLCVHITYTYTPLYNGNGGALTRIRRKRGR